MLQLQVRRGHMLADTGCIIKLSELPSWTAHLALIATLYCCQKWNYCKVAIYFL